MDAEEATAAEPRLTGLLLLVLAALQAVPPGSLAHEGTRTCATAVHQRLVELGC
jgi:hypothetical protein